MKSKSILISIHPCHIEKIFSGEKTYEYRKKVPSDILNIVVYATSPIKKIVAVIDVDQIISGAPNVVWEKTKEQSGITKKFFLSYFKNYELAYAIKLKNVYKLSSPLELTALNLKHAPQSYMYIENPVEKMFQKVSMG